MHYLNEYNSDCTVCTAFGKQQRKKKYSLKNGKIININLSIKMSCKKKRNDNKNTNKFHLPRAVTPLLHAAFFFASHKIHSK